MNAVRKREIIHLIFILSISSLVTTLIMYALKQNISLFYTPSQVVNGEANAKNTIRLGGMVVKNSVHRSGKDLSVQFQLTDFKNSVEVSFQGILPDLFREGQGIVALGHMLDAHHFQALEVLAKHDENYMPPELKTALQTNLRGKQ
jgi:cytochrome c-type biogenesis protein CcmE